MKTIVIDARYLRDKPSGIGTVVAELVERLPPRAPDLAFVLLTHASRPEPVRSANVRCITPPFVPDGPGTLFALGPWLRTKTSWDVFHNTFSALPHAIGARTVVTVHDVMWLEDPWLVRARGPWGAAETAFYQHAMRRAVEQASAVLVPSEATRRAAARFATDGDARFTVTPWGLPRGSGNERAGDARAWLARRGITTQRYVLVVGKSAPYKNHDGALRAFARAFRDDRDTALVLVQRLGDATRALSALAARLGVGERVHAVPASSDEDLDRLYGGAVALLHPSRCEGFGFPLLEAMAAGCPVVTANVTSMPEVAGDAALLAAPDDVTTLASHLRSLADDPARHADFVARGLGHARAAVWDTCVERTLAVYRAL